MTTENPAQTQLISDLEIKQQLERTVRIHVDAIRAWTQLPSDRVDWDLELILDELAAAARSLRQHRTDLDLPF